MGVNNVRIHRWALEHIPGFGSAATVRSVLICLAVTAGGDVQAGFVVVGHDIDTLSTSRAGTQETRFAVNVANYLTTGHATKRLLLFNSNPDPSRDFSADVLSALAGAGFAVTVTTDYTTSYTGFDAIFVAYGFRYGGRPGGFLDNAALINYVEAGGGVYLAGGVGGVTNEAGGWSAFLANYGLAFRGPEYNTFTSVTITSTAPIFAGVSSLRSGFGSSIVDLGTNPNARIVQSESGEGVYALVGSPVNAVPEPASVVLLAFGAVVSLGGSVGRSSLRRRGRRPEPCVSA